MKTPIKNNLIIELHVPDLKKVKNFYSQLGFEISMEDIANEKEQGYLTMTREDNMGNTMLNFYGGDDRVFSQSYFKQFPKNTKRGYASEITIPVNNIESMYELATTKLKNYIVKPLKEIEDHNHKWKDFRMEDPFGFYLRFTEILDWGQK